jgi:hypothetical protein
MSRDRRGGKPESVRPPKPAPSCPARFRTVTGIIYTSIATGERRHIQGAGQTVEDLGDEEVASLLALGAIEAL